MPVPIPASHISQLQLVRRPWRAPASQQHCSGGVCRARSFDLDKLYAQFEATFDQYPTNKLTSLFETKTLFLEEIVKADGGNKYTKPHKKKRA